MNKINWLAIVACAVAGMAIGFLWYGALFQDQWMLGNGITMDGDTMLKNGTAIAASSLPMIVNTVIMIVYALIINWLISITNYTGWTKGVLIGLAVAVCVSLNTLTTNMFASNPMSLSYIDISYILVLMAVMGAILGGWRKK